MTEMDAKAIPMDDLSFDAKVLAGAWFGLGMKTSVTLHLRESRPTARTQAAIDELAARGVISVERFNDYGGKVVRPLMDCHDAFRWLHAALADDADETTRAQATWPLHEPIDEDQAYELMTPFGQGVWDKERRGRKPRDNPYDAETQAEDHQAWRKGHRSGRR